MNLELSAEQQELRATLRRWAASDGRVADQVRPLLDGAAWKPDGAWAALVAMGVTGPGLGVLDSVVVAEELGRVLYPGPWTATAVAAALVPDLPEGAPAAVAPTGGTLRLDGGRVSGAVDGVLGAPLASSLVLPVDGVVAVVDRDDADVVADASVDPSVAVGRVVLDRAPCRVVDGDAHGADRMTVLRAADALGAAHAALDQAVEHARTRHQFGRPIGAFQAVAHLLVDGLETVELARGGVLHAAWTLDAPVGAVPDGERYAAVTRLRAFADRLVTVGETAIQVLGGIGFTWEHDAHLHLRRLLGWSTACAPASSHRIALGRKLVEGGP